MSYSFGDTITCIVSLKVRLSVSVAAKYESGIVAIGMGILLLLAACSREPSREIAQRPVSPDSRFEIAATLFEDDFSAGAERWRAELERGGTVEARNGELVIDVPGGCSVWFEPELEGPLMIEYDATVIDRGGLNDRVSDLNCFWMARDARDSDDLFVAERSGKFSDYDQLRCYYVGYGGNTNSTTRFRRYIGESGNRPILPEHDLSAPEYLLTPNEAQKIQLIAAGSHIAYYRNGQEIFSFEDPEPYTRGWFALRTVSNHMTIRNFAVYRLRKIGSE